MVMKSQVRFFLLMLALPFRFGSNADEGYAGFCQNGNVTNQEFIEMLGVVLSVSREFRVYSVALDWSPGQGVGQAINLDNHPVSIMNYVILDRCQIVPNLPFHHG